jgi:hypothetical protein
VILGQNKQGGKNMDINKITGGNVIPNSSSEAIKKNTEEATATEKKSQETNSFKEQDKGVKIDVQA